MPRFMVTAERHRAFQTYTIEADHVCHAVSLEREARSDPYNGFKPTFPLAKPVPTGGWVHFFDVWYRGVKAYGVEIAESTHAPTEQAAIHDRIKSFHQTIMKMMDHPNDNDANKDMDDITYYEDFVSLNDEDTSDDRDYGEWIQDHLRDNPDTEHTFLEHGWFSALNDDGLYQFGVLRHIPQGTRIYPSGFLLMFVDILNGDLYRETTHHLNTEQAASLMEGLAKFLGSQDHPADAKKRANTLLDFLHTLYAIMQNRPYQEALTYINTTIKTLTTPISEEDGEEDDEEGDEDESSWSSAAELAPRQSPPRKVTPLYRPFSG